MPRVSVIIPTHNQAEAVCRAVDSVLAQTFRDFEIIVADDASTDHTAQALARYEGSMRCLHRTTNGGVGAARNDGIRAGSSEFVCFLDSDDLYLPRRLEAAVAFLDHNPTFHAVYTDCRILWSLLHHG